MKSFYEFLQAMEMNGVQPTATTPTTTQPTATTPGATKPGATTPGAPKPGDPNTKPQPEYLKIVTALGRDPTTLNGVERIKDEETRNAFLGVKRYLDDQKNTGRGASAGSGMVGGMKPTS